MGAAAIFEIDIKKIIALSTLRQLGVIIMILGAIEPLLSFFHLLSHAYFKAILFMCTGMVIHNIKDYQDIRKIRIISRIIPLTFRVMTVANLSLCGLPFLSGFYSKDMILEVMIISNKLGNIYPNNSCNFFYSCLFMSHVILIRI